MAADPIPVVLVTGFLGSGKTTLIAALLRQPDMVGTAVVVNEFGAVGIDDAIIAEALDPGQVLLLANGCLCCTASDDLAATVWALTERCEDRPRRIVIETTGLADPVPVILRLMAAPRLQTVIRLAGVITTVDAVNGMVTIDAEPVALRQAAVADFRIVTKSDLAGEVATERAMERLKAVNPGTPIRVVSHGDISADELLAAVHFDPFGGDVDPHAWMRLDSYRTSALHRRNGKSIAFGDAYAGTNIATWLVEQDRIVDWEILSPLLATIVGRHGDALLRLKGIIHTTGDPRPLVLHSVQRLFHAPMPLDRASPNRKSSVVLIGPAAVAPAVAALEDAMAAAAAS